MRLEDLDLQETNSTYSAIYWDEYSRTWISYLHRGRYRYFYPDQVDEVLAELQNVPSGQYRLYRHDTTREQ